MSKSGRESKRCGRRAGSGRGLETEGELVIGQKEGGDL